MRHTPGPWKWAEDWKNWTVGNEEDDYDSAEKYLDLQLTGSDGTVILPLRIDHYEVRVNGRPGTYLKPEDRSLIAQAPLLPEAIEALRPFVEFVEKWDAKPLRGMDDTIYAIHTGTEWAAELRLSDLRKARAILQRYEEEK